MLPSAGMSLLKRFGPIRMYPDQKTIRGVIVSVTENGTGKV